MGRYEGRLYVIPFWIQALSSLVHWFIFMYVAICMSKVWKVKNDLVYILKILHKSYSESAAVYCTKCTNCTLSI